LREKTSRVTEELKLGKTWSREVEPQKGPRSVKIDFRRSIERKRGETPSPEESGRNRILAETSFKCGLGKTVEVMGTLI